MNKKLGLILAFTILFLGMNFALIQGQNENATTTTCTDNDGGLNYYVPSNVSIQQTNFHSDVQDVCLADIKKLADQGYQIYQSVLTNLVNKSVIDSSQVNNANILLEAYCPPSLDYSSADMFSTFWKAYNCSNGCNNGSCITTTSNPVQCTSHDHYACSGDLKNVLWMNSCNQYEDVKEACPYTCDAENGVCYALINSCTETDGGYNVGVKGSIKITQTSTNGRTYISSDDYCFDVPFDVPDGTTWADTLKLLAQNNLKLGDFNINTSGTYLMETTCALGTTGDYEEAVSYKCPNGCSDGACISSPNAGSISASNNISTEPNTAVLKNNPQESFFQKIINWFKRLFGL